MSDRTKLCLTILLFAALALGACSSNGPAADSATRADTGLTDAARADAPTASDGSAGTDLSASDTARADAASPVPLPRCPNVTPKAPPAALGLDPFYTRYVDAGGIPIVGSSKVPAAAFAQAYFTVANMLRGRPCVRKALALSGIRVGIMARDEVTTDMPEYSDLNKAFPGTDWDKRGRGFGATLVRPLVSGAVENILREPNDRWRGELILLHELAHTFFEHGVATLKGGPALQTELDGLYRSALAKGLWAKTYAASAAREYWAEGVQSWFDNNLQASPPNGIHNHVNTRTELEKYDPALAAFIARRFDPTRVDAACDPAGSVAWTDPTPADPLAASCDIIVGYPKNLGCGAGAPTQSPGGSSAATQLVVVNRSGSATLAVQWLDSSGKAVSMSSVPPRSQRTLSSFAGHVFRVAAGATCRGTYALTYPTRNVIAVER